MGGGEETASGKISYKPGVANFSGDAIRVTFTGKDAHGSTPQKGVDAINIAAHAVIALQEILAREVAMDDRTMVLVGTIRGDELSSPTGLIARPLGSRRERTVCFTDLDRNGHMNNTRYLDWIDDLLPSLFHAQHLVKEFTVCYLSEAREGQTLRLQWDLMEDGCLLVDGYRDTEEEKDHRVFSCKILFE